MVYLGIMNRQEIIRDVGRKLLQDVGPRDNALMLARGAWSLYVQNDDSISLGRVKAYYRAAITSFKDRPDGQKLAEYALECGVIIALGMNPIDAGPVNQEAYIANLKDGTKFQDDVKGVFQFAKKHIMRRGDWLTKI